MSSIITTDTAQENSPSDVVECCNGVHTDTCLLTKGFERIYSKAKCSICLKRTKWMELYEKNDFIGCFWCISLMLSGVPEPVNEIGNTKISQVTSVYCDGGLLAMNKHGGTWSWTGVNDSNQRVVFQSGVVETPESGRSVTNNHTEQIAIVKALEALPPKWSGKVYSDSKIALGRIFWGFECVNLPANIRIRASQAVIKLGELTPINIQGHPTEDDIRCGIGKKRNKMVSIHNVWVDRRCEYEREEWFKRNGK